MDDFLYNLRRDSEKKNRRHSNVQQNYQGQDRRGYKDKKNYHRKPEPDKFSELMPEIKTLLETISVNQQRRADIEERKADALEKISTQLEALITAGGGIDEGVHVGTITEDAPNAPTPSGKSSLHTDRDEITKRVLKMRDEGKTYKEIAKYLEDEKIPTFSRKGEWHAQTIHKICKQVDK